MLLSLTRFLSCVPVEAATKKINRSKVALFVGDKTKLKIENYSGKVKWSSSNVKVCKVTQKGVVRGIHPGTATIVGRVGKNKYTCVVKVVKEDKIVEPNNVTKTDKDGLKRLKEYIMANGQKYNNGSKCLSYAMPDGSIDTFVVFNKTSNEFLFEFVFYDSGVICNICTMTIDYSKPDEARIVAQWMDPYNDDDFFDANVQIDTSTYDEGQDLKFVFDSKGIVMLSQCNTLANQTVDTAFCFWEYILHENGFALYDIGFEKY